MEGPADVGGGLLALYAERASVGGHGEALEPLALDDTNADVKELGVHVLQSLKPC